MACVPVCAGVQESVNGKQVTLPSYTPYSNCKNGTAGPGFILSSPSYLLRLQGKDDFSLCQGRALPAPDLKIAPCSFCLSAHSRLYIIPVMGTGLAVLSGNPWAETESNLGLPQSPWGLAWSWGNIALGHTNTSILHSEDSGNQIC